MITLKTNMVTTQDNYTDNLINEIKIEDKQMFHFSNYLTTSKCYDSNKLVVGKIKDETSVVAIK